MTSVPGRPGSGTGTSPWTYVKLGSDFTTSAATAQNVTGLAFAPAASKTYAIEGFLLLQTPGAAGASPGATWPTGYSDGAGTIELATSTNNTAKNYQPAGTALVASSFGAFSTATSWPAWLRATLVMGGSPSGNFQITLQSSSAGTSVTMKAGSWICYRSIA